MNNFKWKNRISALVGLLLIMSLFSCKDEQEDVVAPETAFVSIYHASPNTGGIDVLVDNRQINNYSFDYSEGTGYLRFFTGERDFTITPFNANNNIADTTTTFVNGSAYSVFIAGEYPDLRTLILRDDTELPEEGKAKLRIVHVSPDAASIDVKLDGSEEAVAEAIAPYSASDFVDVANGSLDFNIETDGETVLELNEIFLAPGNYYTLIVKGYATPPSGNDNYLSAEITVN